MNQRENVLSPKVEHKISISVYVLLFFGAIWNGTGLFSTIMETTTSSMMICVGVLALLTVERNQLIKVGTWFLITASTTILIEYIGVQTGQIFGEYQYSDYLKGQVFGVPVAIGISWAGTCLASFGLVQNITRFKKSTVFLKAILIGFLMMIFDVLLEPVAIKLSYWTWSDTFPPLQNYISWWVIGSVFAFSLLKTSSELKLSALSAHLFKAQVLYFSLILLALWIV